MQIRPFAFGQSDLQEILRIEALSFQEQSKPHFMRQTVDLFPNLTFLAVDQQETIGFISGGLGLKEAWLLSIATTKRKSGVGALLLERLLRTLEENHNASSILLTVDPANVPARTLFKNWGWKKDSSISSYFTEDDHRLLLRRPL